MDGKFVLIDEIHTPDSSRFWFKDSYLKLFMEGREQAKLDKEYVRTWLAEKGFIGEGKIPPIPNEVIMEASRRYIEAYEKITGEKFHKYEDKKPIVKRVEENLRNAGFA